MNYLSMWGHTGQRRVVIGQFTGRRARYCLTDFRLKYKTTSFIIGTKNLKPYETLNGPNAASTGRTSPGGYGCHGDRNQPEDEAHAISQFLTVKKGKLELLHDGKFHHLEVLSLVTSTPHSHKASWEHLKIMHSVLYWTLTQTYFWLNITEINDISSYVRSQGDRKMWSHDQNLCTKQHRSHVTRPFHLSLLSLPSTHMNSFLML